MQVTAYQCDICRRIYKSEKQCHVCMESHRKIIGTKYFWEAGVEDNPDITDDDILGIPHSDGNYPISLRLDFDNGVSRWYVQEL